jgi:hypothetical protein
MLQSSRLPDPRLSVFWRDRLFFVQNRMRSARVTAASFLRRTDGNTRLSVSGFQFPVCHFRWRNIS